MKTIFPTLLFCFFSSFLFSQLTIPEYNPTDGKNSLTLDYSATNGVGVKYDRLIFQKGKYALMGQVGATANASRYGAAGWGTSVGFNAALYNRITFGEHSFEAGLGMRVGKVSLPSFYENIRGNNEWGHSPYVHLGYMYQPAGKKWFLRANLQLSRGNFGRFNKNLSIGGGFKF